MATSLSSRAAALPSQTLGLFRLSFNFLRSLSTSSPSTQNPSASSPASNKRRRRKKKNLFEIAQFLPNWGLGYHVAKTHWTGVSYEITKINLYKDGRHGKAWGIVRKDGVPAAADSPKKISGVHKRCWRYIRSVSKTTERTPKLAKPADSAPAAEVEAA